MTFIKEIIARYIGYYKNSIILQRFANVFSLDVLVKASNMFLLPVYLKLMTQEEFGLFGYILSIIGVFSTILNFGLYLSQAKLFHDYNPEEKKSLVFTINVMLVVFVAITIIPVYLFHWDYNVVAFLFKHQINYAAYRNSLFLAIVITIFSFMLYNFLMTSENIRKFQYYNLVKLVLVNSSVIYMMYTAKQDNVMIRLQYSYVIEFFIFIAFSYLYIKSMKPKFNFHYAKKALIIGIPAMFSSLVGVVYNFNDRMILEKYGNLSDLALYSFGMTMATILMIVFASFQNVLLPFFFKEKDVEKNFNKTKRIIPKMAMIFMGLSVLIFIGLQVGFILGIFQAKYQPVMYILPFLLLAQTIQACQQLLSNYITYFEVVYMGTLFSFIFSVFSIGLNLLFIPRYNIAGAAYSSVLISIISFIIYYYFVKYKCKQKITAGT